MVAVCLASLLAFSAFNANIASIVDLFQVSADNPTTTTYFNAGFDLYDYTNTSGFNWYFNEFNQKLYTEGYLEGGDHDDDNTIPGWGDGDGETQYLFPDLSEASTYYPLYLGFQYKNNDSSYQYPYIVPTEGAMGGNDHGEIIAKYNYCLAANSGAGASPYGVVQGLVDDTLSGGVPTQGLQRVTLPYFDSTFLSGVGSVDTGNKFRFRKHTGNDDYAGYYVFDSEKDGLSITNEGGVDYYTADVNGTKYYDDAFDGSKPGFFPLVNKNFGFGAVFTMEFTISKDGKTPSGEDMTFNFRGDDDVWVFIDGHLALDLGGAHGKCSGNINFAKAKATADEVINRDRLSYDNRYNRVEGNVTSSVPNDLSRIFNQVGMYGDATKTHTLKVFYLERGAIESNCLITFNFNPADNLTIVNNVDVSEVNAYLQSATLLAARKEGIQYQLQNKGEATTEDSPDDRQPGADYDEPLPFPTGDGGGGGGTTTKYILTYKKADGTVIESYEVPAGNIIKIKAAIDNLPEGIELKTWKNAAGTEYVPGQMITMNGPLELTAEMKVVVTAPKVPTIVYANHTCGCAGLPGFMAGGNNSANKMTNITGNYFGYLLTYDWTLPENSGYIQHKNFNGGSDSQYTFGTINAGDIVFVTLDNDANSNCSKTTYTYSSLSGLDSNVYNDWLKGYVKLYYALVDAKADLDADDTLDGTAYATAHSKYKNATFGTAASEFTSQITALQTAYGITPRTLNAALPPDLETEEFDSPDILANIFDPDDPDAADTAGATTDQPETTGDQPADDTQTTETTQATEPEQATEPTQATEPEQPSEPEQTNEPDANAPASTGLTSGAEGHWAGSSDYANVGNTNYQLKYIAGGKSVLRKTMTGSNTFNLVADQSATFSNQFSRGSLFRSPSARSSATKTAMNLISRGRAWSFTKPPTPATPET